MPLIRRDLLIGVTAASLCLGGTAIVRTASAPMPSAVFDWNSMKAEPTVAGEVRRVFRAPTATLDELEAHVTTLNPGQSPHPPHTHANEEVIIIREGTVESFFDGTWHRVGPGSIVFYASNQPHTLRNVGSTPATYHVVSWHSPGTMPAAKSGE